MKFTFYGATAVLVAAASVASLAPHLAVLLTQLHGAEFPAALLALLALVHLGLSIGFLAVVAAGLIHARGVLQVLAAAGVVTIVAQPAMGQGIDGLQLPDRPTSATPAAAPHVVVQPGDTLWAIAGAGHMDVAATAHAVHDWHRVNRDVIGPDPDLLLPGQVLRAPQ